nr:hypothetical protein Iba_chr07cCG1890 [Ipomoea batatas]GMD17263.1 hypothetical protein Iba_chr07dCG1900 [Ipomoea batatas]GMD18717.1 hypothetical protein Iba_chr07eCG1840 [Ipomoea batatas]
MPSSSWLFTLSTGAELSRISAAAADATGSSSSTIGTPPFSGGLITSSPLSSSTDGVLSSKMRFSCTEGGSEQQYQPLEHEFYHPGWQIPHSEACHSKRSTLGLVVQGRKTARNSGSCCPFQSDIQ